MLKQVQLLDCTLRDGGLGLEDAYKNKISNVGFSEFDSKKIIEFLNKAKFRHNRVRLYRTFTGG